MPHDATSAVVTLLAGIPAQNNTLYHQLRFSVGDPAALVILPSPKGRVLILRDIEMARARRHARADRVFCPADFAPSGGLSGDRETATAQAVAEFLAREGIHEVRADRTLPLIYAHFLSVRGVEVRCDVELGVLERRQKDSQEVDWLRQAQAATESAMRMACELVGRARTSADATLVHQGQPLTSERVREAIDIQLLGQGFENHASIVAGGPQGADCHDIGSGALRTGQPVIIDIFPRDRKTRYFGDCTRTVVHGDIPEEVVRMHAAVVRAKAAAVSACRAGVTGEAVHAAASAAIVQAGYRLGLPPADAPNAYCGFVHGTGHGIGLDVHEPPLLDKAGPPLLVGDAVTIEPGLYCRAVGGIRVEDMVIVREDGCENLNRLPEGLQWT